MMKYFAYGSNMDQEQMRQRLMKFNLLGKASLADYGLRFNKALASGTAAANIEPWPGKRVEGLLYEVESLLPLDIYEGHPDNYRRRVLQVYWEKQGLWLPVQTYIALPHTINNNLDPATAYLARLLSGAPYLSEEYVNFLQSVRVAD